MHSLKVFLIYLCIHLFTVYFCTCGSQRTILRSWLFSSTVLGPMNLPQVTGLGVKHLSLPVYLLKLIEGASGTL